MTQPSIDFAALRRAQREAQARSQGAAGLGITPPSSRPATRPSGPPASPQGQPEDQAPPSLLGAVRNAFVPPGQPLPETQSGVFNAFLRATGQGVGALSSLLDRYAVRPLDPLREVALPGEQGVRLQRALEQGAPIPEALAFSVLGGLEPGNERAKAAIRAAHEEGGMAAAIAETWRNLGEQHRTRPDLYMGERLFKDVALDPLNLMGIPAGGGTTVLSKAPLMGASFGRYVDAPYMRFSNGVVDVAATALRALPKGPGAQWRALRTTVQADLRAVMGKRWASNAQGETEAALNTVKELADAGEGMTPEAGRVYAALEALAAQDGHGVQRTLDSVKDLRPREAALHLAQRYAAMMERAAKVDRTKALTALGKGEKLTPEQMLAVGPIARALPRAAVGTFLLSLDEKGLRMRVLADRLNKYGRRPLARVALMNPPYMPFNVGEDVVRGGWEGITPGWATPEEAANLLRGYDLPPEVFAAEGLAEAKRLGLSPAELRGLNAGARGVSKVGAGVLQKMRSAASHLFGPKTIEDSNRLGASQRLHFFLEGTAQENEALLSKAGFGAAQAERDLVSHVLNTPPELASLRADLNRNFWITMGQGADATAALPGVFTADAMNRKALFGAVRKEGSDLPPLTQATLYDWIHNGTPGEVDSAIGGARKTIIESYQNEPEAVKATLAAATEALQKMEPQTVAELSRARREAMIVLSEAEETLDHQRRIFAAQARMARSSGERSRVWEEYDKVLDDLTTSQATARTIIRASLDGWEARFVAQATPDEMKALLADIKATQSYMDDVGQMTGKAAAEDRAFKENLRATYGPERPEQFFYDLEDGRAAIWNEYTRLRQARHVGYTGALRGFGQMVEAGAVEGERLIVRGFRAETGQAGLRPSKSYALHREMAVPETPAGVPAAKSVVTEQSITLQKPLRVQGVQGDLLDQWAKEGDIEAARILVIADQAGKPPPGWYIEADTYIATKAGSLGYDGILYEAGLRSEVVVIESRLVRQLVESSAPRDLMALAREAVGMDRLAAHEAGFENLASTLRSRMLNPEWTPAKAKALQDWADHAAYLRGQIEPGRALRFQEATQDVAQRVTARYKRAFTNYDDTNFVDDAIMWLDPYWIYQSRRWGWITRQMVSKPGFLVTFGPDGKYYRDTKEGYIATDGPFQMNPVAGGALAPLRRLTKPPYPPLNTGWFGGFEAVERLGMKYGVNVVGPHMGLPLRAGAQFLNVGESNLGSVLPSNVGAALDAVQAVTPNAVRDMLDKALPNAFQKYTLRQVLLQMDGSKPEDWAGREGDPAYQGAVQRSNLVDLLTNTLPLLRYRPAERQRLQDFSDATWAKYTGISVEEFAANRERGRSLARSLQLPPSARAELDAMKGMDAFLSLSEPLQPAKERELSGLLADYFDSVDLLRQKARTTQEGYDAMRDAGKISSDEWWDLKRDLDAEVANQTEGMTQTKAFSQAVEIPAAAYATLSAEEKALLNEGGLSMRAPLSVGERNLYRKLTGSPIPRLDPIRAMLDDYYAINAEKYRDAVGKIDVGAYYRDKVAFIANLEDEITYSNDIPELGIVGKELKVKARDEVLAYVRRHETPMETQAREGRVTFMAPWYDLETAVPAWLASIGQRPLADFYMQQGPRVADLRRDASRLIGQRDFSQAVVAQREADRIASRLTQMNRRYREWLLQNSPDRQRIGKYLQRYEADSAISFGRLAP